MDGNPLEGKRVIGYVVINWASKPTACDLYEGNRVILPSGKLGQASEATYEKLYELYQKGSKSGDRLRTAYEYNEAHGITVPALTADPKAAEKEARIRMELAEEKEKADGQGLETASEARAALKAEKQLQREEKARRKNEAREAAQKRKEDAKARKQAEKEAKRKLKEEAAEGRKRKKEELIRERQRAKLEKAAAGCGGRGRKLLIGAAAILALSACALASALPHFQAGRLADGDWAAEGGQQGDLDQYVVIALSKDLAMAQMIRETDIKGVIVSAEQYEKYNSETYVDSGGKAQYMSLLSWDGRNEIIGKYAASDLKADALLYDVNVTSQHVIADKTYVEATINGTDGAYEVEADALPGSTDIKIVAVITTDGEETVQVLLSEMTLQDRSLESIFNAAGQDILEQLSQGAEEAEGDAPDAEEVPEPDEEGDEEKE